jgi:hemerythrin-like domain-containing protein
VKRSAALTPLSRDHHRALEAALRLRRADEDTVEAAIAHFQDFFEWEAQRHFAIEEEHVLPALSQDDEEWAAGVRRVLDDHAAIRAHAASLDGVADARALGERLNDHVRFEERVLFVLLEERLAPDELARLGEAIAEAERA